MEEKKATQSTGCSTCKGVSKKQYSMIVLGFYILGTSVYGTVELIKYIATLF